MQQLFSPDNHIRLVHFDAKGNPPADRREFVVKQKPSRQFSTTTVGVKWLNSVQFNAAGGWRFRVVAKPEGGASNVQGREPIFDLKWLRQFTKTIAMVLKATGG